MNNSSEIPITPVAAELLAVGAEAQRISRLLDYASFHSRISDWRGGTFEKWELRKDLGHYPKGSIVGRVTLDRLLK